MKRLPGTILLLTSGLCLLAGPDPRKKRILFLVDGSSSMSYNWQTNTRFKAAATIINQIMDSVQKADPEVQFALRVFGHQYPAKDKVCNDTRLEVPFNLGNRNQIQVRMNNIQPVGSSPIAYSLQELAEKDLLQSNIYSYGIILITDGQESCGGDICNAIDKYLSDKFFFKPQIIGLLPDQTLAKYYECAGEYTAVTNPTEVNSAITKITAFERYVKPVVVEKTVPRPTLPDIKPAPKATTPGVSLQSPAVVPTAMSPEKDLVTPAQSNSTLLQPKAQPSVTPKAQAVNTPQGSKTDIDKLIAEDAPKKEEINSIKPPAKQPQPVASPTGTKPKAPAQVKVNEQPISTNKLDQLIAAETPAPVKTDIAELPGSTRTAAPLPVKSATTPRPAAVKVSGQPVSSGKLEQLIEAEAPAPEKATIATVPGLTRPQPVKNTATAKVKAPTPVTPGRFEVPTTTIEQLLVAELPPVQKTTISTLPGSAPTKPKVTAAPTVSVAKPKPVSIPPFRVPEADVEKMIVAELPPVEKSTISTLQGSAQAKPKPTSAPALAAPKPVSVPPFRIPEADIEKMTVAELPPVVKQDIASLPPAGKTTPLTATARTSAPKATPINIPAGNTNQVDQLIQQSIAESRTSITSIPAKSSAVLLAYTVKPGPKPVTRKIPPSNIPVTVSKLIAEDTPPPVVAATPAPKPTPAPAPAPAKSATPGAPKEKVTNLPDPVMRMQPMSRPGKLSGPGQFSEDIKGGKPQPVKVEITGMDKKKAVLSPDVISGTVISNLDNQTKLLLYLKDKTGQYYQSAPQVALKDPKTGQIKYSFARKMDPKGEPIPYQMPAGGFYDVNIMGAQPVSAKGISIENGKTNKLYLTLDGARLSFTYSRNPKRPVNDLSVKVWRKGTDSTRAMSYTADEGRYFEPGDYEIEINTYPITRVQATISFGEEARVDIPESGKLEITNTQVIGNGRLAVIENGQPKPITTMVLNGNPVSQQLSLLPGTYAIAYNPDPANPNTEDNYVMFEIRSNTNTQLKLPLK